MIAGAIRTVNDFAIDLLILARGGGSIEDLWAFNEEILARAIVASRVPIATRKHHWRPEELLGSVRTRPCR